MIEPDAGAVRPPPPQPPNTGRFALLALVALLAIVAILLYRFSGEGDVATSPTRPPPTPPPASLVQGTDALARAAGCTVARTHRDEGAQHLSPPGTAEYRTEPPTSGMHYGSTTATGAHAGEVAPELFVHNLEHGHVVITYDPSLLGPDAQAALEAVARARNTGVVLTPRRALSSVRAAIGFSSWTHSSLCRSPGLPDALYGYADSFVTTYGARGPEGFLPGNPNG